MDLLGSLRPPGAPREGDGPSVCPHCWMVNPGQFRLCARCGADMATHLQESGGLQRTAPVQSPVPVAGGPPLSLEQRLLVGFFILVLALGQLAYLIPAFTGGTLPEPVREEPRAVGAGAP